MSIKPMAAALLLALSSSASFALTVQTFNKVFNVSAGGGASTNFQHLDSDAPRGDESLLGLQPIDAYTPGVLPFTFNDNFQFRGLAAGSYTINTTIGNLSPGIALGFVQIEWFSGGSLHSQAFSVAPDFSSASLNTTISVDAGCVTNYCVRIQVFGWDNGTATVNYGGVAQAQVVPEPATQALLLVGMASLAALASRRR